MGIIIFVLLVCIVIVVPTNCSSGDFRLRNGSSDSEGIMEVCYQGVWTTVNWYTWEYHDARVLCRQLGYHDKCEQYNDNCCQNNFVNNYRGCCNWTIKF